MDGLRVCYEPNQSRELYKHKDFFWLVINGKQKKISERDALREYLDPASIERAAKPHEIFPKMVQLIDLKWNEKESFSTFRAGPIEFTISYDFKQHVKLNLTKGKLWPRQTQSLKL